MRRTVALLLKGGPGSGFAGHGGRPGLVGGSRPRQASRMRQHGFGTAEIPLLARFTHDADLKAHLDYRAAKAGDAAAAARLVEDLAGPIARLAADRFGTGVLYAAPTAREAAGDNAIPDMLATALACHAGARVDADISQVSRAYHTGADAMERLISKVEFHGPVERGASYVLCDDVMTMGGTLAEMADHIHQGGGRVAGVVLLVNASRTRRLIAPPNVRATLERRFGHEIRDIFGIEPAALTSDEARYLIGFRSIDELRNRRAKAEESRLHRLRAKGVHEGMG